MLADGCQPNRDTLAAIRSAGFARVEAEHFSIAASVVGPRIAGVAHKG